MKQVLAKFNLRSSASCLILIWILFSNCTNLLAQPGLTFEVLSPDSIVSIKPVKFGYIMITGGNNTMFNSSSNVGSAGAIHIDGVNFAPEYLADFKSVTEQGDDVYFWSEVECAIFNQKSYTVQKIALKSLPEKYFESIAFQSTDPVTGYVYLNISGDEGSCMVLDITKSKIVKQIKGAWIIATSDFNYKIKSGFVVEMLDKKSLKTLNQDIEPELGTHEAIENLSNPFSNDCIWLPENNTLCYFSTDKTITFKFIRNFLDGISQNEYEFSKPILRSSGMDKNGFIGITYENALGSLIKFHVADRSKNVKEKIDTHVDGIICRTEQMTNSVYDHYRERWIVTADVSECYKSLLPAIEINRKIYNQERTNQRAIELEKMALEAINSENGFSILDKIKGSKLQSIEANRLEMKGDCVASNGIFSNEKTGIVYLFYDGGILVYNKLTKTKQKAFSFPEGKNWRVYQILEDSFVFLDNTNRVLLYDLSSGDCLQAFSIAKNCSMNCIGSRGILSAVDHNSGKYFWLNLLTGKKLRDGQILLSQNIKEVILSNSMEDYFFTSIEDTLCKYNIETNRYSYKILPFRNRLDNITLSADDRYLFAKRNSLPLYLSSSTGNTLRETARDLAYYCDYSTAFFAYNKFTGNMHTINGLKVAPEVEHLEFVPELQERGLTTIDNHGISDDGKYWYFTIAATDQFELYEYDVKQSRLINGYVVEGTGNLKLNNTGVLGDDLFYDRNAFVNAAAEVYLEEHRIKVERERADYEQWLANRLVEEKEAQKRAELEALKVIPGAEENLENLTEGLAVFEAESQPGAIAVVQAKVLYENVKEKDLVFNVYNWIKKIKSYEIISFHFKNNPSNEMPSTSEDHVERCNVYYDKTYTGDGDCVYLHGYIYRILTNTIRIY